MPEVGDMEKQASEQKMELKKSVYAGLGWLDRLLVLWILLAIIIGILLGNFVESVGPALQKGKFVGVSVPIGEAARHYFIRSLLTESSNWPSGYDVPNSMQGEIRDLTSHLCASPNLDPTWLQHYRELDRCSSSYGELSPQVQYCKQSVTN